MLNAQCFRQLAHHAIAEMDHVAAHPRCWRPKRGTPAHKLFDGGVSRARSRLSQPCVSTHMLEDDQHVRKSVRSVNVGVHRTLLHTEIIKRHNCVRLSPMRGFFQRMEHQCTRLGVRTVQAEPNRQSRILSRTSSTMVSHTQCRSNRAIVASTPRCPTPPGGHTAAVVSFSESPPAGAQITRGAWCSTRYSPSESSESNLNAVSRVDPPSAAAAFTPRTTSFVGNLSLPAKRTSVYLTLACMQTGPHGRVTQRDSRSPQHLLSPGTCTIVYGNCARNTRHPGRR